MNDLSLSTATSTNTGFAGTIDDEGAINLLTLTDPAGNAKRTFKDIFSIQLKIAQNTTDRTSFFLPTVGQIDPNNPADLAKIELFSDLLNLRADVVSQGLQAFQRIEDASAKPLG